MGPGTTNSSLRLPSLWNRRFAGKFIVPRTREAYDAQVVGQNRKFQLNWNNTLEACSSRCSPT